jgi:hypothetical protein
MLTPGHRRVVTDGECAASRWVSRVLAPYPAGTARRGPDGAGVSGPAVRVKAATRALTGCDRLPKTNG